MIKLDEDETIDRILSKVDKLNRQGKFEEIDNILKKVNIQEEYISGLLCFLSSTKHEKKNYLYRDIFYELVLAEFKRRGESEKRILGLLMGLK